MLGALKFTPIEVKDEASRLRNYAMPHESFVYQGEYHAAVSWPHRLYSVIEASVKQKVC